MFSGPGGIDVNAISLWDNKASSETYNTTTYPEVLNTQSRRRLRPRLLLLRIYSLVTSGEAFLNRQRVPHQPSEEAITHPSQRKRGN